MTGPGDYRFTRTHEWVRFEDDTATVGISSHAQSQLGDVIYVELPAVGASLRAGEKFGTVESVKAASDLYSPVDGKVVEVNSDLADSPEKVNSDPLGAGWMIKLGSAQENPDLLDAEAYQKLVGG